MAEVQMKSRESVDSANSCVRQFQLPNGKSYDYKGPKENTILSNERISKAFGDEIDTDTLLPDGTETFLSEDVHFFGPDGSVYSSFYEPLDANEILNNPVIEKLRMFPQPDEFNTYAEYEESLLQWGSIAQQVTQSLYAPSVLAGHLFRPNALDAEAVLDGKKNFKDLIEFSAETAEARNSGAGSFSEDNNKSDTTPPPPIPADPWQSMLVPSEPQIEDYNSFVEYDTAMQQWAVTCFQTLPFIPPHPAQFQELLGLQRAKRTVKQSKSRHPQQNPKKGRTRVHNVVLDPHITRKHEWDLLSNEQRKQLTLHFEILAQNTHEAMILFRRPREQFGESEAQVRVLRNPEPLPRLHGVLRFAPGLPPAPSTRSSNPSLNSTVPLPTPTTTTTTQISTANSPAQNFGGPSPSSNILAGTKLISAVRRRDLTGEMMTESQDIPSVVRGREVVFPLPRVDAAISVTTTGNGGGNSALLGQVGGGVAALQGLGGGGGSGSMNLGTSGAISFVSDSPLAGDVASRMMAPLHGQKRIDIVRGIRVLDCSRQFEHLNSVYYPAECCDAQNDPAYECYRIGSLPYLDVAEIVELLNVPMPLDRFSVWLAPNAKKITQTLSPQKLFDLVATWQDERPMDSYLHTEVYGRPESREIRTGEFMFLSCDPMRTQRNNFNICPPTHLKQIRLRTKITLTVRGNTISWVASHDQTHTHCVPRGPPAFASLSGATVELFDELTLIITLSERGQIVLRPIGEEDPDEFDDEEAAIKMKEWFDFILRASRLPVRVNSRFSPIATANVTSSAPNRSAMLYNAKLALLTQEALIQGTKTRAVTDLLKDEHDTTKFFNLTRALTHLCEHKPCNANANTNTTDTSSLSHKAPTAPLFCYTDHVRRICLDVLGEGMAKAVERILCVYYCQRLQTRISPRLAQCGEYRRLLSMLERHLIVASDEDAFEFPNLMAHLLALTLQSSRPVTAFAPTKRTLLSPHYVSRTFSTLGTFVVLQVMVGPEMSFRQCLWSSDCKLVQSVLESASALSPALKARSHALMRCLMRTDWATLVADRYAEGAKRMAGGKNRPLPLQSAGLDVDPTESEHRIVSLFEDICCPDYENQPLQSQLLVEWLTGVLDSTTPQHQARMMFLFPLRLFQNLMDHIDRAKQPLDWRTIVAAEVAVSIAKRCAKLNLIETASVLKSGDREKAHSDSQLVIVLKDVSMLWDKAVNPRVDIQLRALCLTIMRHLLKNPKVFGMFKGLRERYLNELLPLCTETSSIEFGLVKNSWKLLFQLSRYHSTDMLRTKDYHLFLASVHPRAGIHPNTCGMHYIAKLLMLKEYESLRAETGRDFIPENSRRPLERLSRQIASDMQMIHLHMLYTNVATDNNHDATFQKLARLYRVVHSAPSCERHRPTSKKKAQAHDYWSGVQNLNRMFEGSAAGMV